MTDRFEPLNSGEVVSIQHDAQVLTGHRTFRVGELNDSLKSHLENALSTWNEEKNAWFSQQGIECEALRFGSNGWKKGRIRLCLEFCPDDVDLVADSVTTTTTSQSSVNSVPQPLGTPTPPVAQTETPNIPTDVHHHPEIHAKLVTPTTATSESVVAPLAGVAIGGVATAVIMATGEQTVTPSVPSAVESGATSAPIPPLADSVLELEEHHSDLIAPHDEELGEIAFDFDSINGDRGTMIPSGMMELDLVDLGLDVSEHDFLNFEANGIPDSAQELISLQDLDRPENSGMLMDEVWRETSQPNWPSIN
jgi:KGK domain